VALLILFGGYKTSYAISDGIRFIPNTLTSNIANFSGSGCENYYSNTDFRWLLTSFLNNASGAISSDNHNVASTTCLYYSPLDLSAYSGLATASTTYYFSMYLSLADYLSNTSFGYFIFFFDGTNWSGDTLSTITPHFTSFTYSTTTEYANMTGYWKATTTPNITQRLSFWQFSNQFGKEDYIQVIATTTGYFDFSFPFRGSSYSTSGGTTTAPILTSFTLNASLDEYNENYYDPFGQLGLDITKYITNLDATSTTVSGINYGVNDYSTSTRSLALYPEYECGITSLTGCFKNALIWTFYPTQEALDNWNGLLILIQSKAPVGYFYMTKDSIGGLTATSTKAFNVVIPKSLKQYIFTPFDTGISAILWFFFIFNFYKRLKTITI